MKLSTGISALMSPPVLDMATWPANHNVTPAKAMISGRSAIMADQGGMMRPPDVQRASKEVR